MLFFIFFLFKMEFQDKKSEVLFQWYEIIRDLRSYLDGLFIESQFYKKNYIKEIVDSALWNNTKLNIATIPDSLQELLKETEWYKTEWLFKKILFNKVIKRNYKEVNDIFKLETSICSNQWKSPKVIFLNEVYKALFREKSDFFKSYDEVIDIVSFDNFIEKIFWTKIIDIDDILSFSWILYYKKKVNDNEFIKILLENTKSIDNDFERERINLLYSIYEKSWDQFFINFLKKSDWINLDFVNLLLEKKYVDLLNILLEESIVLNSSYNSKLWFDLILQFADKFWESKVIDMIKNEKWKKLIRTINRKQLINILKLHIDVILVLLKFNTSESNIWYNRELVLVSDFYKPKENEETHNQRVLSSIWKIKKSIDIYNVLSDFWIVNSSWKIIWRPWKIM